MDILAGTILLRPYVFGFLAAFLIAGAVDIGARRTAIFMAWVWPVALLAELSSTRIGVPFGLYHYTGSTRGQEVFVANVPLMDSLSVTFLAYAAFCMARAFLGARRSIEERDGFAGVPPRRRGSVELVSLSASLMMLLDVVIDPVAIRGDRWFLGRIFYYADGGEYFGVPLSNFLGWALVGAVGVGGYLVLAGDCPERRLWPGMALYYAVLSFSLGVTVWIGEWTLVALGVCIHAATAATLWSLSKRTGYRHELGTRGAENA